MVRWRCLRPLGTNNRRARGISAASVVGSIAVGPRVGARVRRCGEPCEPVEAPPLGPRHARLDGFDLHANVAVREQNRERLEKLSRHGLRPPIALDRPGLTGHGEIVLRLRKRWSDGTTDHGACQASDEDANSIPPSPCPLAAGVVADVDD